MYIKITSHQPALLGIWTYAIPTHRLFDNALRWIYISFSRCFWKRKIGRRHVISPILPQFRLGYQMIIVVKLEISLVDNNKHIWWSDFCLCYHNEITSPVVQTEHHKNRETDLDPLTNIFYRTKRNFPI